MPLQTIVYCSIAELERYLSANAVIDFADHDQDSAADTDVVEDAINQATDEIDLMLRQRYTQAQLQTSTIVTRWCVTVSARFLCTRRGNPIPDSVERDFDRVMELMQLASEGKRQLPGVALRDDLRPTMSNLTVDRRYQRSTVRVTSTNSSDPPTKLTQDTVVERPGLFD